MTNNSKLVPKNILIIRNAYSFDFGGGERMPVDLGRELSGLGYSPIIVSRSPKLIEYAQSNNLPTIKGLWWGFQNWSGKFLLLFPLYIAWQLLVVVWYLYIIVSKHVDVVHPQSRDDFIAATLAARLLRKTVLWTDHADLKYIYQNGSVWYKNPIGKMVFYLSKHARAVILVSKNEKNHIHDSLGRAVPDNYVVIYNGVSSTKVEPIKRNAEDMNTVIFGATSRMVTAKGISELIEAFQSINRPGDGLRLWLFGEGPEMTRFKNLASDNESIVFWGFPSESMARLASTDIFVHPSYHEGFSISLVEAAKLGLPIIACAVGGNPEIVDNGSNGILVPAQNTKALADAMKLLANNKDMRLRYGKAAHETYEHDLVWEKMVKERYVPLYG